MLPDGLGMVEAQVFYGAELSRVSGAEFIFEICMVAGSGQVGLLHELWMAPTRLEAIAAFGRFLQTGQAKYPKAAEQLVINRDALLPLYHFPAEHWVRLRTTNPIESTFATVRHRTTRTKNSLAFKLVQEAKEAWRRIRGSKRLAER